ncbi:LCP family protein [Longirhabdus pacifica]|uniref:LCP family protein n=1 Tax=Longirhabdus pacifica TaxID=2305227 RepID=UPI00100909AE|nr:LCP family protein [Longirhabdus pacifica]
MTSFFVYQVLSKIEETKVPKTNAEGEVISQEEVPEIKNDEDFYALVFGMDYREDLVMFNTDSIMVIHAIPKEETIKLVSIPRDLYLANNDNYYSKINSFFYQGFSYAQQKGRQDDSFLTGSTVNLGGSEYDEIYVSTGMASLREGIEDLLDIEISHTVMVNFQTVIDLIDEVGGVEIDVQRSLIYRNKSDGTDIDIAAGLQVLDGKDALGYARHRKDDRGSRYYSSDFERGLRQQEIVDALADELLSWGSATKVTSLLDIVSDNIKTDMNMNDMYSLITTHYNTFNSNSIVSIPFPEQYANGQVVISDDELSKLRLSFHALEPDYSIDQLASIPDVTDNPSASFPAYTPPAVVEEKQEEEVSNEEEKESEQDNSQEDNTEQDAESQENDESNDGYIEEDTSSNDNVEDNTNDEDINEAESEQEGSDENNEQTGDETTSNEEQNTNNENDQPSSAQDEENELDQQQSENNDQTTEEDKNEEETESESDGSGDGYLIEDPVEEINAES